MKMTASLQRKLKGNTKAMLQKLGIIKELLANQSNPERGLMEISEVKRLINKIRIIAKSCNRLDYVYQLKGSENYLVKAEALFKKQIAKRGE